jgi:hypothetical protein
MSAAQIQLAAARDVFLSGKPERTFFEGKYKPVKNKLSQTYEYPFDNPVTTFGQTGICTIPKKGDAITGVTLKVTLPQIYTPISEAMYVYPVPSSRFDGSLYVEVKVVSVTSSGTQLTIVTVNPVTANVGAAFSLFNTGLFDGDYVVKTKVNLTTFTADSTAPAAVSTTGTVSILDVRPRDVTGYFSTQNFTLWSNDFTDIPISLVSLTGNGSTVTGVTDGSLGQDLLPGATIIIDGVTGGTGIFNGTFTILTYTPGTNTFTYAASGTGSPANITNARMRSPAMTIQYDPALNVFKFTSALFTSIRFVTARDAAFWGFDFKQGPVFPFVNGTLTSQWTLVQGGWIYGFLPPADSSYVDSVANKLIKSLRIMVGKQTINEFSGEYIELYNDLNTSYENQAIYKLLCGKYDTTQASQSRTYYVKIPLGFKSIPNLTYQNLEVQVDFDILTNLSTTINPGSDFFDPLSYTIFDATDNVVKLQGELINTIATLSFEEYIAFRTEAGSVVIYNSTKPIDDSDSYSVVSSYLYAIGESFFTDFTTLGQTLYAQAYNNFLLRGNIIDLVDGDISGFTGNDFLPTLPTSTITNTSFAADGVGGLIQTATPHYIRTGDTVTVQNATPSDLNGSYTVNVISSTTFNFLTNKVGFASNPGVTITKGTFVLINTLITQFGTGVQVTTLTPHYYSAGDQIQIAGSVGYDGIITVLYVTSPTKYTFFATTSVDPPIVVAFPNSGNSVKQIEYSINPPNGLVTDGVYVYYAIMSNRPTTYFIRYDHSKNLFDNSNAYLSIDFTSNVTSSYEYKILDTIFTGTSIYVLPKEDTSNIIYIYNINGDFMDPESWQSFDYYTLLQLDFISTGICIGPYIYFIADGYKIVQYNVLQSYSDVTSYTTFDTLALNLLPWSTLGTNWNLKGTEMPLKNLTSTGKYLYMSAGGITSDVYLTGQACVIRIDVANGLGNPDSYEYYSSSGQSPIPFDFSSNTYAVNAEGNPSVTLKTPITLNSPLPNLNLSIVGDGTTATVNTQNTHSLYMGMVVFIQGSTSFNSPMPYPVTSIIDDKTYTFASGVVANDTPAGVTLSILNLAIVGPGGGAAYVTTLNPHGLSAGMVVLIKGSNSFDNLVPYTVTTIIDETNYVFATSIVATDITGPSTSAGVTVSTLNASIVGSGTGAECTTLNPHGLTDGMFVIIQGSTHFDTPEPIAIKYKNPYTYAFGVDVSYANFSINGNGVNAIVTTFTPHNLSNGTLVLIQGSAQFDNTPMTLYTVSVIDGTRYSFASGITGIDASPAAGATIPAYTDLAPNAGVTITAIINKSIIGDGTSTQVTIQDLVLKNHLLSPGDIITIQNAEPAFLNGPQIVTEVPNTLQFKFASPYLAGRYIPKIFINGPRYVYMYTNDTGTYGNTQAKNIIRFDQYTQTPTLTASLLVDFEKHEIPPPENQLIGVVQVAKSNSPLEMQFKGPVKEFWFTGIPDSTNVFQYSSIANQTSLALTHGEEIVSRDVGSYRFYNTVQPFENHTTMPTRNFSMYSFEMNPESTTPNGTVNFSRISEQIFSNASATVWARSYNILKIQGGVGGLLFNS